MSLTEDLNNLRNHAVSQLPPETLAIIEIEVNCHTHTLDCDLSTKDKPITIPNYQGHL